MPNGRMGDMEQLIQALYDSGLESSNLILGIDFTKSNEWTGRNSFGGRCLHHLGNGFNPYEQAISIIGKTLSRFDEDDLIPCFGFGDVTTHDRDVFSFYPDNRPCKGFEEALSRYREIVPHVRLSGPTSFAPIIETAIEIVDQSGGQYHVLLIIADGQITRSLGMGAGQQSLQEENTIKALARASEYPLSIIEVGVGDGPWNMVLEFADNISARAFDNIQFVNFTEIMSRNIPVPQKETEFALAALRTIPLQYRAIVELQRSGNQRGHSRILPLPLPSQNLRSNSDSFFSGLSSLSQTFSTTYSPSCVSTSSERRCPICSSTIRDLLLCGHQVCHECGEELSCCPICGMEITTRIRL